jgi:hypothetical protein
MERHSFCQSPRRHQPQDHAEESVVSLSSKDQLSDPPAIDNVIVVLPIIDGPFSKASMIESSECICRFRWMAIKRLTNNCCSLWLAVFYVMLLELQNETCRDDEMRPSFQEK